VATEPSERMYHLKNGYKMAGDILIGQSLEMNLAFRKKLIFPALFCYRHFIEMSLKSIIEQYGFLAELPQSRRYHLLRDLWSDFEHIMHATFGDDYKNPETLAVEKHVRKFDEIDRKSDTFRYHKKSNGENFTTNIPQLNLENLVKVMNGIENYFDIMETILDLETYNSELI
jgi:hypothetical protein